MERTKKRTHRGFTLIELVIVITILAILAAVAIPAFQNLTTQARNAGTNGALGGLRSALAVYRANAISAGCDPAGTTGLAATDCWPRLVDITSNSVMENNIVPANPWAVTAGMTAAESSGIEAATSAQAAARTVDGTGAGWRYYIADNATPNGIIYANSTSNGGGTATENTF
ncbi:MAG: type II secretion system protein [Candidatus Omnitrophica bacterium]|nr:type II secretion system protein [Candidatus Omnitrophota bacterium]